MKQNLFEGIIFGNKLQEIENQYSMTQKQFAEKLGVKIGSSLIRIE